MMNNINCDIMIMDGMGWGKKKKERKKEKRD